MFGISNGAFNGVSKELRPSCFQSLLQLGNEAGSFTVFKTADMAEASQWARLVGHGSLFLSSLVYSFQQCSFYTDLYAPTRVQQSANDLIFNNRKYNLLSASSFEAARYLIIVFEAAMSFLNGDHFFFGRDLASLLVGVTLKLINYNL